MRLYGYAWEMGIDKLILHVQRSLSSSAIREVAEPPIGDFIVKGHYWEANSQQLLQSRQGCVSECSLGNKLNQDYKFCLRILAEHHLALINLG